jgi:hypothetical protein
MSYREVLVKTAPDGTKFKINEEGMVWRLYVKEKNKEKWGRIQSSVDLKILKRIMMNQKEFKKLKEMV